MTINSDIRQWSEFYLLISSLKIQHVFKISRQWNEFYSLQSVKTSTFSFQISAKGKEEILKLVIYNNRFISQQCCYSSSLSSKGLSLFHRGIASGGLDSSSLSFGDWLTVFMLIEIKGRIVFIHFLRSLLSVGLVDHNENVCQNFVQ